MRVLIADDNLLVSSTLADMIMRYGHEVIGIVRTGLDAVRFYSQHIPDMVFMDFSMTKLNGANASRMILSQYPSAKIVMLSGFLTPEDLDQVQCGAFLREPKPLEMDRLKEILDSCDPEAAGFNPS